MNSLENPYGTSGYLEQQDLLSNEMHVLQAPQYAGFWLRVAAYLIDAIIFWVIITIFSMSVGLFGMLEQDPEQLSAGLLAFLGVLYLSILLYFPIMESSAWQATLGKRAVGIMVTDTKGNRLSFLRALGRTFGKILSALILYVGFMMAGFTDKKQALHDMLADALVIKGTKK